ncbi:oligosaccharide flippase family protein [Winogradskyella ursingii]|uniref:oligosaccharide flippase family protein n=1 Tax=Winogradskyella ursingii TaxID=2686079 RepID=UPI0015CEE5FD|nr:oligosaccharide flippase family protein [Winogradskyella ursingii]
MNKSFVNHVIFKNFLALSTLQIVNLVLPFVTLPYLARVLGVSNYGVVVMVYSIMQLLFVITDYGFNLSATKEISLFRHNLNRVNTIFSSIMIIKAVLLLITFGILLILIYTIPMIYENKETYIMGFGMVVGQTFTPIWLFQGMEKMKHVTFVNLVSKLTFTLLIFAIIKTENDYIYVPLLYSTGFVLAGLLSLFLAYREFGIKIYLTSYNSIRKQLNLSTQYFFSRAAVAGYSSGNNFIVGLVLGEFYAGIFAVAEKVYVAMTIIYTPLSDSIYPHMVMKKDLKLFKKIFLGATTLNFIVSFIVFMFSLELISFVFGEGYSESAHLLKYFCVLSLLLVPSTFIGYPLLGAFNYEKYANYSVVLAGCLHLIILFFVYKYLSIYSIVLLLIFTQLIVFAIRLFGVKLFLQDRNKTISN